MSHRGIISMFLRTNKALKFLALILFGFELIAPICVVGISVDGTKKSETQVSTAAQHQSPFSPILLELNKNEEEKDGQKSLSEGNHCSLPELLHLTFDIHRADITSYINALQQFKASPALFQVHCKLQI